MKVLLVEDDEPLCEVFSRNIKARGHAITVVNSADEATSSLDAGLPDVMVLDVSLPDYSGWEVLRRLSDEARCRLNVVMISAAPLSRKRIEEFKPAAVLQKPFPMSALINVIEGAPNTEAIGSLIQRG